MCHNPDLGFATKAKASKSANQKWSIRVTFHASKSVGRCEGMNPHTPKWAPTLGVGAPMDLWIFREQLLRSKLIRLKKKLCHWKALRM
jgi:hypothetical protein